MLGMLSLLFWIIVICIIASAFGGGKKPFRWLQRELPLWEEKNIINQEQGNAILGLYNLKRVSLKKKMDMIKVLTLIGVIFVGVGVIFFVASNWQRIPAHLRTIMILSITIATLYAGYVFTYVKEGFVNLGKSLLLLSSLFWGGTIALIGQIYNIPTSENWFILLLWAFPILPIAVFFKNDYTHILASVLFLIWNFLYSANNNIANYYYPVIVFFLLLPTARDQFISRRINIAGLVATGIYCSCNKYEWLALFISAGLLAYYLIQKEERAYLYTAALSFIFWNIAYFTVRPQQLNLFFLVPIAVILYLTYRDKIEENLIFCLAGLMVGLNLALSSISQLFGYPYNAIQVTVLQSLLGIAIYSAGIISQSRGRLFPELYKIFGYLITFVCVYLLAFQALLKEWSAAPNTVYFFSFLLIALIIAALIADEARKGCFKDKAGRIELTALTAVLIGNIILLVNTSPVLAKILAANIILVIFALSNIFLGVEWKKPSVFTAGIIVFVLFIITRYIDVTWKLKEKSLFFIVGGLVILSLGIVLEKQRRKIIERMKAE
jgi:uncharacterized membrane protein